MGQSPKEGIRVLVGMVLPSQHKEMIDQLRSQISPTEDETLSLCGQAPKVQETLKAHLRAQLSSGIPTATDRETLQSLK